jgi:hypothetical protein
MVQHVEGGGHCVTALSLCQDEGCLFYVVFPTGMKKSGGDAHQLKKPQIEIKGAI